MTCKRQPYVYQALNPPHFSLWGKNFHFFFQLEDNNTKWKLSVWGRNSEETRCPQPMDFSVSKRNNRGIPSLNTTVIPQHPEQPKDLRETNQGWNIRASSPTLMRCLHSSALPQAVRRCAFTNSAINRILHAQVTWLRSQRSLENAAQMTDSRLRPWQTETSGE